MASGEGFGHVFSAKSCAVVRHFNQKWFVELRWCFLCARRVILLCTRGEFWPRGGRNYLWFLVGFLTIAPNPEIQMSWAAQNSEIIWISKRMQIFRSVACQGPEKDWRQGRSWWANFWLNLKIKFRQIFSWNGLWRGFRACIFTKSCAVARHFQWEVARRAEMMFSPCSESNSIVHGVNSGHEEAEII